MTTPEQIIAKIEEIESISDKKLFDTYDSFADYMETLLNFKQTAIRVFNLPTADPPEGSPGQSDMGS